MSKFDALESWFTTRLKAQGAEIAENRLLPSDEADAITAGMTKMIEASEAPTQGAFYHVLNESPSGNFVVNTSSRAIGVLYYCAAKGWLDEAMAVIEGNTQSLTDDEVDDVIATAVPTAPPLEWAEKLTILADVVDRTAVVFAARPSDLTEPLNSMRYVAKAMRTMRDDAYEVAADDG